MYGRKPRAILLVLFFVIILCGSSCRQNETLNTTAEVSPFTSSVIPEMAVQTELSTQQNYRTNEEIELGDKQNIIEQEGIIKSKVTLNGMMVLGVNRQENTLLYFDTDMDSLVTFKMDTGEVVDTWPILKGRTNKVYAINKTGPIIAWAECPFGNINPNDDPTKGAGWEVYYADLTTKEIKRVDGDNGIKLPNQPIEYGYLAPSKIAVSPDYLSYITFDYNLDQQITAVIKLYHIKTGKLEIIDYLNQDLSNHAFGYPNISGDQMTWCKAEVKPDGTYKGQSYLYDINSKVITALATDENIINPTISGDYICAQGLPGKTFYDGEICIYNIKANQWQYKMNGQYEQYNKMPDVYLNYLSATDQYLLWETAIQQTLIVFRFADQKLYKIVSYEEGQYVRPKFVQDNNVLVYGTRPVDSNEDNTWHYVYLK